MINFKQGENVLLEVVVIDNRNIKVDLTLATKVRVALYNKQFLLYKYLDITVENALPNYGIFTVDTVDSSKLILDITREQSQGFAEGNITAIVLIESATDVVEYSYEVATISKGYLKDEIL